MNAYRDALEDVRTSLIETRDNIPDEWHPWLDDQLANVEAVLDPLTNEAGREIRHVDFLSLGDVLADELRKAGEAVR